MKTRMIALVMLMFGLGTAFIAGNLTRLTTQFNTQFIQADRALPDDQALTLSTYQPTQCQGRIPSCTPAEAREALIRYDRGRLLRSLLIGGAVSGLGLALAYLGFRSMLKSIREPQAAVIRKQVVENGAESVEEPGTV